MKLLIIISGEDWRERCRHFASKYELRAGESYTDALVRFFEDAGQTEPIDTIAIAYDGPLNRQQLDTSVLNSVEDMCRLEILPGYVGQFSWAGLYLMPRSGTTTGCYGCGLDGRSRTAARVLMAPLESYFSGLGNNKEIPTDNMSTATNTVLSDASIAMLGLQGKAPFYDKMGVELEGRWLNLGAVKARVFSYGARCCGDGSVHYSPDSNAEPYEIQTKPGSVVETLAQIQMFYPDEADKSCGMHIHTSFLNVTDFTMLNTLEFFAYFRARWEQWGKRMGILESSTFWARLRGDNDFCLKNEEVIHNIMNAGDRYKQLNFAAYSEHSTVECRLLPMFKNIDLAFSAVAELLDIYVTFLSDPESFGLKFPQGEVVMETPELTAIHEVVEVDVPPPLKEEHIKVMEIHAVPPPQDGMVRVAVAGGNFNMETLRSINRITKQDSKRPARRRTA